jgi:N-acyl-D-amino-acid deacylase
MPHYDLIISGAQVVDGTGNPRFYGDVALQGQMIAAVSPPHCLAPHDATTTLEADGLVLAPGFIDIMSHSIQPLFVQGDSLSKIAQGVTTEIMGEAWTPVPVGGKRNNPLAREVGGGMNIPLDDWQAVSRTWARFSDWLEAVAARGVAVNIGSFLGGGSLREYVCGYEPGESNPQHLQTMKRVMSEAMKDGAFGVSYALVYAPDSYASTSELTEVAKVVGHYGGIYATHIRSESSRLLEATEEALSIGRHANVGVHLYHLKACGQPNWAIMEAVLQRIEEAQAAGQSVTADVYPYTASGAGLDPILPGWVHEGGNVYQRLAEPALRQCIRADLEHPSEAWEDYAVAGAENIFPMDFKQPAHQSYIGKSLAEISLMRGTDWIDTLLDLLLIEQQGISSYYVEISEANLVRQLAKPWIMIASDEGGYDGAWAKGLIWPHPRSHGTFSKVLGYYVREQAVLTLEDAVRKMTSLPASRLGIMNRGLIRPGFFADLVLFNPEMVVDRATYQDPFQLSVGAEHVWVNGSEVFRSGQHTGALPGQVLYGPGKK